MTAMTRFPIHVPLAGETPRPHPVLFASGSERHQGLDPPLGATTGAPSAYLDRFLARRRPLPARLDIPLQGGCVTPPPRPPAPAASRSARSGG